MSRRTFIPRWNSYRKPPVVFWRQKSVRGLVYRSPRPEILNDNGRLRWYSNPAPQVSKQEARMTRERLTQRVGLFRNAKHSEVVISGISKAVKRACHKQINRLVASDGIHDPSAACGMGQLVVASDGNVGRQSHEISAHNYCYDDDYGVAPVQHAKHPYSSLMRRDDSGASKCFQSSYQMQASIEYDAYSDSQQDEDYHMHQQLQSIASKITKEQMQTPKSSNLSQEVYTRRPSNAPSLPLVSARILSALPPIYLRDDFHDKYDAVAVRLLSESITRSETELGSTNNIFRSFLDRTGCIAIDEARSQPNDNEYENIFQNYSGFNAISGERQDTPELEKLFNQTVGASKLDDDPEFLHDVESSSKLASITKQTSSLMTPASLGSHRPAATSSLTENVGVGKECTTPLSNKFPFSKSSSSSSNSSPFDKINFEWTIPKAEKG